MMLGLGPARVAGASFCVRYLGALDALNQFRAVRVSSSRALHLVFEAVHGYAIS